MKKLLISALLASSVFTSSFAADKIENKKELQEVEASLRKNNPDLPKIKEIRSTPIANIYEVVVNEADVLYTEKEGKYLFFGELIKVDKESKSSLTQKRVEELTSFDFKDLKFNDSVTKKIGNGKDVLVTFEDPNCGYCKKFQPELAKLNNVTVHTFIIPILGPKSIEVAKIIWCSNDKEKSWSEFMKSNTLPKVDDKVLEKCDIGALTRNVEFANKHKINGTPTIFLANGKSFKGYATADKIIESLKQK